MAAKQCRISMFINQWISYTSSVATGGGVWCWPVSSRPLLYLVKVYWEAPQYSASAVWPAGEVLVGMRVERGETTLSRPAQLRFKFSSTKQDRQQQVETQHARIRYSGCTALTACEGPVMARTGCGCAWTGSSAGPQTSLQLYHSSPISWTSANKRQRNRRIISITG